MDMGKSNSQRFLISAKTYLVCSAVAFAPAVYAEARAKASAAESAGAKVKSQSLAKTILEGLHTKNDVLGLLSHAGVSIEGLRFIDADLAKRMPEKSVVPKLSLGTAADKDQVTIEGKATGLHIASYSPLKLKFQDRSWSMNEKVSTDENYASVMKFLEARKSVAMNSLVGLVLPGANALFENGMSGLMSGTLIGALGGGLFGMAFGFDPLMSLFVGGAGGALFGYLYGKSNEPPSYAPYVPGQAYPAAR